MAEPFRPAPARTGFGQALRSKRVSTMEAIEDLLAQCESLRQVTVESVDGICEAHGVDLESRFPSDRKDLYRRYLAYCLDDKILTEEENADLEHLRNLLHLGPEEVIPVHDEMAREVYGKAIQEVLADLEIDADEEAFLRRLRGDLKLSDTVAADLLERGRRDAHDVAMREASTPDHDFLVYRAPAGEFTGRSDVSFEAAVTDALSKAVIAVPLLHWFEVSNISGYVGDGKPKGWHVTVRGGIEPEK